MIKSTFQAALNGSSEVQDSDEVKIFTADGVEHTISTIDRIGDSVGLYPNTEPNVTPFIKIQLS